MKYEIIKGDDGKAVKVEFEDYKHLSKIPGRIFQYLVERPAGRQNDISSIINFVYDGNADNSKKRSIDANICTHVRPMLKRIGFYLIRSKNKMKILKNER